MRIRPWYFRIQQNWVIVLQVYVTHFEYWLFSKFSHLTARQNKSHPGGEIFRISMRGKNIYFSRLSEKTTGNLFSYEQPLTFFITCTNCSFTVLTIWFSSYRLLLFLGSAVLHLLLKDFVVVFHNFFTLVSLKNLSYAVTLLFLLNLNL